MKKNKKFYSAALKTGCGLLAATLAPSVGRACACGCGVFDVATSSMFPNGAGGMAYLQYDFQDQDRNWSGTAQAPAANNPDKQIETDFFMAGFQYMFNSSWGVQLEVPYDYRTFKTTSNASGNPITTINWGALGDIRLEGIYTGFFADMSAGVTFGVKLPTGDWTYNNAFGDVDRDSEIGTGSTDIRWWLFHPRGQHLFRRHRPGPRRADRLLQVARGRNPFFTLTQNALADGSYLDYLRAMYGGKIYTPTAEDSQRCYQEVLADAQRRLQEHKLKPGRRCEDGRWQGAGLRPGRRHEHQRSADQSHLRPQS